MAGHPCGKRAGVQGGSTGRRTTKQEDEEIQTVRWAAGCRRGVTVITLHHHPTHENVGLSTEQLNKDVRVCGVWIYGAKKEAPDSCSSHRL